MDQQFPSHPDYESLKNNGITISENDYQAFFNAISKGIEDVRKYLGITKSDELKIVVSDELSEIGFSSKQNAINIHPSYLGNISKNTTPIEYRDQLACFAPDKFFVIFKYLYWLRLFGREGAIHYFQKEGDPKLSVRYPNAFPESLSTKALRLSDLEVEARTIVDEIALQNSENPVWRNVDKYFSQNFSTYYNKSIEELASMPRPDVPITFEIESILS